MGEVEEPELIHFTLEPGWPMRRRREVVQEEKPTGRKQLDDLLGVVALAPTVAEEDIERGVPLKQPPVPGEDADPLVVREHPGSATGQLLVTFHGDEPGTGTEPTVQPGGTDAGAGAALGDDSVGLRGGGQREQPAHLGNAALLEPRLGGDPLGSHHARRNGTLCHDHEPPLVVHKRNRSPTYSCE